MGSDGNKMNDGIVQPMDPALCANGCGFYGQAATMGLCSKCYRDQRMSEEREASTHAAMDKFINENSVGSSSSSMKSLVDPPSTPAELTILPSAAVEGRDQAVEKLAPPTNRCLSCRKKVGVMGFKCRCGSTFCGTHRYPEQHDCEYDFKGAGRAALAKDNPVVKADKIDRF